MVAARRFERWQGKNANRKCDPSCVGVREGSGTRPDPETLDAHIVGSDLALRNKNELIILL